MQEESISLNGKSVLQWGTASSVNRALRLKQGAETFLKAKVIAAQRSQQTAHFLAAFEADSFGCF